MKPISFLLWAALGLLPALSGQPQTYSIDWFTVDGGGGTSSGGVYSISGSIGQPDAGHLAGGSYVVDGGFWGGVTAIQTPGAPLLRVQHVGNGVKVLWNSSATGYLLDESSALSGPLAAWSSVSSGLQTNSTEISITIPSPAGAKFYRLRKP